MSTPQNIHYARTDVLDIAYQVNGSPAAPTAILLHGFPYDPHCYDEVAPRLVEHGYRVIVPYLRGYGPTRFLDAEALRSGQQAALGHDLLQLMNALGIERATLAGYDWGGRAACIVAALWPERVTGLVTADGYNIQNIAASVQPMNAETEHRYWYQYYFHTERGQSGLQSNRRDICKLLWKLWSPDWQFDQATFDRTAAAFDNPDFVDVVIHSYRHRFGYVAGDPSLADIERKLAGQPQIAVPAICLHGLSDGVVPVGISNAHEKHFVGRFECQSLPGIGHNIPQEAPGAFVDAILKLQRLA
jgi:pimeloyl-ACP methyl ester carboxylesterase